MPEELEQQLRVVMGKMLGSIDEYVDFFTSLFMNMPSGVAISSRDHKVLMVNNYWLKMFKYDLDDVIGKSVFELISNPEKEKESRKLIKGSIQNKNKNKFVKFRTIRYRSDKTPIHTSITVVPIYIKDERVCHFGIYQDITAEVKANEERENILKSQEKTIEKRTRQIEEVRRFYQSVLEDLGEAVFVEDEKGCIIYTNSTAQKMLDYTKDEILGQHASLFIEDSEKEEVELRISERRKGMSESYETILAGKNNKTIPVLINVTGKYDGDKFLGNVAGITDISHLKKAQNEMVKALEKATSADKAKSEFLANMSHEIRTPLNGVIGMAELLSDTELTREQTDYVRTIKGSGDTLLSVINDILDFSKIEAGKLEIEKIDFHLNALMDDTMKALSLKAHEKHVEVIYEIHDDIPGYLIGDPGRIRQILTNLVGNAVKFTAQGVIHVTVFPNHIEKNNVDIGFSVKDTGIGIKKKDLARLFKSFHQADASTTRKFGGTGLGLAISKQLTELMGGTIYAKSQYGSGSEFIFNIKAGVQKQVQQPSLRRIEDVAGMGVLVVDDVEANRLILKTYLEKLGFDVEDAESAETGLKIAELAAKLGEPFPIIISDYNMPKKDGAWFGGKIRSDSRYDKSKLIMLTSRGLPGDGKRLKAIGYDAYLSKPIRQSHVFDTIMMLLSGDKGEQKTSEKQIITKHSIFESKIRRTNVLVVDDNGVNLKIAEKQLSKMGFKYKTVDSGPKALKALSCEDYDVVLMDRQMPVMGGIECARKIRAGRNDVRNPDIPIIALTADAMKDAKKECLEAGMNGYISKPVKINELFEEIRRILWPEKPDE